MFYIMCVCVCVYDEPCGRNLIGEEVGRELGLWSEELSIDKGLAIKTIE